MDSRQDGQKNTNDGGRANKFLYKSSSNKTNPWRTQHDDDDDGQADHTPHNATLTNKPTNNSTSFDLEGVWSIRKNVQVSQAVKNGSALQQTSKSFYSRHGRLAGSGESFSPAKKQRTDNREIGNHRSLSDSKSWSVPRPGYSYSDRFPSNNSTEDIFSPKDREFDKIIATENNKSEDEDFESKKNKLNIRLPIPGAPQLATREMSARTKRAHNIQQAHLKSSGLGQYTSPSGPYSRQVNDVENVEWKPSDDFT